MRVATPRTVLALRRRVRVQPVACVGADGDLGGVAAQRTGQRHDLDDGGAGSQQPRRGYDDRRTNHPLLGPDGSAQVQLDNHTRGRHRALRLPRCARGLASSWPICSWRSTLTARATVSATVLCRSCASLSLGVWVERPAGGHRHPGVMRSPLGGVDVEVGTYGELRRSAPAWRARSQAITPSIIVRAARPSRSRSTSIRGPSAGSGRLAVPVRVLADATAGTVPTEPAAQQRQPVPELVGELTVQE
jgi:hypothetical protein